MYHIRQDMQNKTWNLEIITRAYAASPKYLLWSFGQLAGCRGSKIQAGTAGRGAPTEGEVVETTPRSMERYCCPGPASASGAAFASAHGSASASGSVWTPTRRRLGRSTAAPERGRKESRGWLDALREEGAVLARMAVW